LFDVVRVHHRFCAVAVCAAHEVSAGAVDDRFRAAVRATKIGPAQDIPHITVELLHKYLTDLRKLGVL
jgi:hypothetical protein